MTNPTAPCDACGHDTKACARCGKALHRREMFTLPLDFGNLDARITTGVCDDCYRDYQVLGFVWLGREVPASLTPGAQGTATS